MLLSIRNVIRNGHRLADLLNAWCAVYIWWVLRKKKIWWKEIFAFELRSDCVIRKFIRWILQLLLYLCPSHSAASAGVHLPSAFPFNIRCTSLSNDTYMGIYCMMWTDLPSTWKTIVRRENDKIVGLAGLVRNALKQFMCQGQAHQRNVILLFDLENVNAHALAYVSLRLPVCREKEREERKNFIRFNFHN